MSTHTSFASREFLTLAGLGFINPFAMPSGNHKADVTPEIVSHLTTKPSAHELPAMARTSYIRELPAMARTNCTAGFFSFATDPSMYLETPLDRSDPISQFIDGLRERALCQDYECGTLKSGVPHDEYSSSAIDLASLASEESSRSPFCDCENCGEGYFATWEDDEDDDFEMESPTSSLLPDNSDDFDDGTKTPCVSSYSSTPDNSPASSGAQTRSLGSFSVDVDNALDTPRSESSSSTWPSHLPTEPGSETQSLFDQFFDESAWADVDEEDDDFITSYSTSSDSCPPTPPLSDIGDDVPADEWM